MTTTAATTAAPKFATLSATDPNEKYVKIHPYLTELTDQMLTVESVRTR